MSLLRAASTLFASFLILSMLNALASAGEINACKYLVITDFTSDPYGIARDLRAQASAKGFTVVSAVADQSPDDLLRTCVMSGSWSREIVGGGELSVRVVDAVGGELVGEAAAQAARMGVSRTVRALVGKIYSQLEYTGYSEDVYRKRIQREFPTRPKIVITEEEIKKREPRSRVEGIWSDTKDQYRLGIVTAPEGSGTDYFAVVLRSNSPLWQPSEIKAEIRSTASPDVFTCTYFLANKKPAGTTLTLDHDSVLRGSLANPNGSMDLLLVRVWPSIGGDSTTAGSAKSGGVSGTGFLLSRSGLLATNWHVVADAKKIGVAFPGWSESASAEVVIKDATNDLAILRVNDSARLATTCPEFPFQLASASKITLGQKVSTIGYPLAPILGSDPKYAEGVVSSKTGYQDDPRSLQISAQVQPGSSGSPLFDGDGNVIGVVVATLDAGRVYQVAGALPQNVNFAIRADYLLSLLGMIPSESPAARTTAFSPEKAARCVAILNAW